MKLTRKQLEQAGLAHLADRRGAHRKGTPSGSKPGVRVLGAQQTLFLASCKAHGLPEPVEEYRFAPPRRWRFDWLFEGFVAVEIVGGTWVRGHHSRGRQQQDDMARRNEAQIAGFLVLEFTPQQVESGEAFPVIARALGADAEHA